MTVPKYANGKAIENEKERGWVDSGGKWGQQIHRSALIFQAIHTIRFWEWLVLLGALRVVSNDCAKMPRLSMAAERDRKVDCEADFQYDNYSTMTILGDSNIL